MMEENAHDRRLDSRKRLALVNGVDNLSIFV